MSAPTWRKSTFSAREDCPSVAFTDQGVLVRHSKDPDGSILTFTRSEWRAFVAGVKDNEFDLPGNTE